MQHMDGQTEKVSDRQMFSGYDKEKKKMKGDICRYS